MSLITFAGSYIYADKVTLEVVDFNRIIIKKITKHLLKSNLIIVNISCTHLSNYVCITKHLETA